MKKVLRNIIILTVFITASASQVFAISKVAARYNVMEFNLSTTQPHGSYNNIGIGGYKVSLINDFGNRLDADLVYDNSVSFGINYGRLINDNMIYNIGFSYENAKISSKLKDLYTLESFIQILKLRIYNLDINWNYYISSPIKQSFAPYVGVGIQTGLLASSIEGFSSESDFVMATAFNIGADITVWKAQNKMSSLAISSINSYQFYASDSRPKYITIGFGLRYFMRP